MPWLNGIAGKLLWGGAGNQTLLFSVPASGLVITIS